jgi:hypothetical protein
MNILDALIDMDDSRPAGRVICDDGLLSVSDEAFECKMRELGFDKEDREEWMQEPVNMRHVYMNQWGGGRWKR